MKNYPEEVVPITVALKNLVERPVSPKRNEVIAEIITGHMKEGTFFIPKTIWDKNYYDF